jgi:CO dehydrogenase maturation factor
MSFSIALSGKGGVGKTSIATLVVKNLLSRRDGPVFAVDADPNSNFADQLGVKEYGTVGDLREELLKVKDSLPAGMSKADFIGYRIQEIVVESKGFDLLNMGRPEGPGCYCYVNSLLREFLDGRAKSYRYTVVDNEAGMEHLSRRTTRDVDVLLVVSDLTPVSLAAAFRIGELARSLDLKIRQVGLLLNRTSAVPASLETKARESGLAILGTVPEDPEVIERSRGGAPLLGIGDENPAYTAVAQVVASVFAGAGARAKESAGIPRHQESAEIPRRQESAGIPRRQESAGIPRRQESAGIPRRSA